jgi:hypothetical protein
VYADTWRAVMWCGSRPVLQVFSGRYWFGWRPFVPCSGATPWGRMHRVGWAAIEAKVDGL